MALLSVRDLRVEFATSGGVVTAVDGASFDVGAGETVALLGESGSGKSVTAQAVLGIVPKPAGRISGGTISYDSKDLLAPGVAKGLRGREIAMVFQDPLSSLNPVFRVGAQIGEMFRRHRGASRREARAAALDLMKRVGIPAASKRLDDYPHQFSGGMRQRVMIAMALACRPRLLIADEPTTALDVTVQAQILDLIRDLQREFNSAVIIITHDLGVVAELADDIQVMYAGRAIEYGTAEDIFDRPQHPYTWGLLGAMPRIDQERTERLIPIKGTPPSLINVPPGCAFNPRCNYAHLNGGASETEVPQLLDIGGGHQVACHLSPEQRKHAWETDIKPKLS